MPFHSKLIDMNKQIPASELPLQSDGAIYHLNLHPDELADNVLLVGTILLAVLTCLCLFMSIRSDFKSRKKN